MPFFYVQVRISLTASKSRARMVENRCCLKLPCFATAIDKNQSQARSFSGYFFSCNGWRGRMRGSIEDF